MTPVSICGAAMGKITPELVRTGPWRLEIVESVRHPKEIKFAAGQQFVALCVAARRSRVSSPKRASRIPPYVNRPTVDYDDLVARNCP